MNLLIQNYINQVEKNKPKPKAVTKLTFDELATAWKATGELKYPEYEFDSTSQEIMRMCFSPLTLSKGGVICGSRGIGKTLNLDIFSVINTNLFQIQTQCYEVNEIELNYKVKGADYLDRIIDLPCLVINDAGAESILNDYGTTRNLIADILLLRYRLYQRKGFKTYLTTNMSWEKLGQHYGSKLSDRFKEMFNAIEIIGDSKR